MFSFYSAEYTAPSPPVPPTPWTLALLNPWAWYSARTVSSLLLSGTEITQWNDLSGNSRHLVKDTSYNPVYLSTSIPLNTGRYGVNFKGGGRLIRNESFSFSSCSCIAVLFHGLSTNVNFFFNAPVIQTRVSLASIPAQQFAPIRLEEDYFNDNGDIRIGGYGANYDAGIFEYWGLQTTEDASFVSPTNTLTLAGSIHDGSDIISYLNGVASTNSAPTGQGLSLSTDGISLGSAVSPAISGSVNRNPVTVCELVFLTSALSESDRQKAEGYLAHEWNLEGMLDAGHPYKDNPPTV
jgi:hypothetical protein